MSDTISSIKRRNNVPPIIGEGIFISICTVGGYAIAFAYEVGYCSFFKIPFSFISISITSILNILMGLFFLVFLLAGFEGLLKDFGVSRDSQNLVGRKIHNLIWPLLLFAFAVYFLGENKKQRISLAVSGLVLVTVCVLVLIALAKFVFRKKSDKERPPEKAECQDKVSKSLFWIAFDTIINWFPRHVLATFVLIIAGMFVSFLSGHTTAKLKKEFYVIQPSENRPTLVILQIYGDKLICTPIEEKAHVVKPKFIILNLSTQNIETSLQLELRKVGPLKLDQED